MSAQRRSAFDPTDGEDAPAPADVHNPPHSVLDLIPVAEEKRKSRSRGWEASRRSEQVSYRGVPPKTHQAMKEIAESLEVRVDDVARAFLEFSLACYQRGEIEIEPVLDAGRRTLFPTPGGWNQHAGWSEKRWNLEPVHRPARKKADKEHSQAWRRLVTYRGIPQPIQNWVRSLQQQKQAPTGEIVTRLLHHALAAYQNGRLVLTPQAHSSASLVAQERSE